MATVYLLSKLSFLGDLTVEDNKGLRYRYLNHIIDTLNISMIRYR